MSTPWPRAVAALLVVWAAWLVYSVLLLQNVLAGLVPVAVLLFAYYGWRLLMAFEEIADALQRLADARERSAVRGDD